MRRRRTALARWSLAAAGLIPAIVPGAASATVVEFEVGQPMLARKGASISVPAVVSCTPSLPGKPIPVDTAYVGIGLYPARMVGWEPDSPAAVPPVDQRRGYARSAFACDGAARAAAVVIAPANGVKRFARRRMYMHAAVYQGWPDWPWRVERRVVRIVR